MAGYDRRIDPRTKDYVDDGRGGMETTRTIETAMYHQLQDEEDEWVGDPDAGCGAFRIKRKDNASTMLRFKDVYERALRVFVEDGRATGLVVQVERTQLGHYAIATEIHDTQSGQTIDFADMLPFGA